jgi:hypothetical protein
VFPSKTAPHSRRVWIPCINVSFSTNNRRHVCWGIVRQYPPEGTCGPTNTLDIWSFSVPKSVHILPWYYPQQAADSLLGFVYVPLTGSRDSVNLFQTLFFPTQNSKSKIRRISKVPRTIEEDRFSSKRNTHASISKTRLRECDSRREPSMWKCVASSGPSPLPSQQSQGPANQRLTYPAEKSE